MNEKYNHILENFDNAHNRFSWITKEQFAYLKQNFHDLDCNLRVFISYSNEDRKIAAMAKDAFSMIGVNSFMAHEDIQPTKQWKIEIISELKKCNLFAPIITENFKQSDWANQESGAAIIRGINIIPISIALPGETFTNPYGFIGDYQALKYKVNDITSLENKGANNHTLTLGGELCKAFLGIDNVINKVRTCFLNSFLNSESFAESNSKVKFLESLGQFDADQLKMIVFGFALNDQIFKPSVARRGVQGLIENNLKVLDDTIISIWESSK